MEEEVEEEEGEEEEKEEEEIGERGRQAPSIRREFTLSAALLQRRDR